MPLAVAVGAPRLTDVPVGEVDPDEYRDGALVDRIALPGPARDVQCHGPVRRVRPAGARTCPAPAGTDPRSPRGRVRPSRRPSRGAAPARGPRRRRPRAGGCEGSARRLASASASLRSTRTRGSSNVGVQRIALRRLGDANVGFASVTENIDLATPGAGGGNQTHFSRSGCSVHAALASLMMRPRLTAGSFHGPERTLRRVARRLSLWKPCCSWRSCGSRRS